MQRVRKRGKFKRVYVAYVDGKLLSDKNELSEKWVEKMQLRLVQNKKRKESVKTSVRVSEKVDRKTLRQVNEKVFNKLKPPKSAGLDAGPRSLGVGWRCTWRGLTGRYNVCWKARQVPLY